MFLSYIKYKAFMQNHNKEHIMLSYSEFVFLSDKTLS